MRQKIERPPSRPSPPPGFSVCGRPRTLWPLTLLLFLFCFVPARGALGQDFAAAGRHFAAAQDAFGQGKFAQAAQAYQAAYEITQDPVLLFNIGESWQRAGDGQKAIKAYRAYLAAQPTASDRPEVERRLKELEEAAGPAGPGPANEQAKPAGSGEQAPAPAVKPVPDKSASPPSTVSGDARASGYRTAAWASVATTVALVTAGAVLGLAAQSRADELNRRTTQTVPGQVPPVYDSSQNDAYSALLSDGRTYNTAAITCFAVGGAAAVTSAVLFLVDWRTRAGTREAAVSHLGVGPGAGSALPRLGLWRF